VKYILISLKYICEIWDPNLLLSIIDDVVNLIIDLRLDNFNLKHNFIKQNDLIYQSEIGQSRSITAEVGDEGRWYWYVGT
jgi:hypothetical protein